MAKQKNKNSINKNIMAQMIGTSSMKLLKTLVLPKQSLAASLQKRKWDQSKKDLKSAPQGWPVLMPTNGRFLSAVLTIKLISPGYFLNNTSKTGCLKYLLYSSNTFWCSCHDLLCSFTQTKMKGSTSTPQRFTPCRFQNQLISILSSTTTVYHFGPTLPPRMPDFSLGNPKLNLHLQRWHAGLGY